jgi:energy-coupling factor transporter transmembrane protein EcfT
MIKQLNEKPEKFSTHGVKAPNYVEFVIQKCLKKKKKQRFQSIDEIITLFKKGKVSFWAKLKSRVICSPLRFAIPIFLILLSLFSTYFITSGSKVFDSFKIEGTKILAKNKFGFKIWEKDFTPFRVLNMSDIGDYNKKQYSEYLKSTISTQPKLFFLKNPENKKFSINSSIYSEDCDNRIALINRKGNVLSDLYISRRFDTETYDFTKTFYLTHFERIDLTGDNNPESLVLGINHSNGMYPYAFI